MKNIYKKRLMGATALSALALGVLTFNAEVTQAEEGSVERIQGNDRYETATLISSQAFESSDTVIIANAMEFADALSGVPLAYEKKAPILLAYGSKLRAATLAEIERLGAKEAVILGGDAAISQSIENELKVLGLSVQRLSGDNRYETSAIIANELAKTAPSDKAVVVDGMEFADAMSIAPFSAQEGMPIYLTKTNSLSNTEELKDYSETYIVGGENAVSKIVEDALNGVTRLAGMNRYETNREVIDYFGVEADELYVSTGLNFADALTGSVLAARNNSAIALVKGDIHSQLLAQFEGNPFNAFTILGGEAAVSNKVQDTLITYIASKTEVVKEEKQEKFVDFVVKELGDDSLPIGEKIVNQKGERGYDLVTYEITYVNEIEKIRTEINRITVEPIVEKIYIGTQVTEVVEEVIIENEIDFDTVNKDNDQLPEGETSVIQEGIVGYDEVTYSITFVNGVETDRVEVDRVTIEPIDEIKKTGTKTTEILQEVVHENETAYDIIEKEEDSVTSGERIIETEGQTGYDEVTYDITYVNGEETDRVEVKRITIEPIKEVVVVGTQVTEVIEKVVIENEVNFETVNQDNDQLPEGETLVILEGKDGYDEVTYEMTIVNGVEIAYSEIDRISVAPTKEIIEIGTQVSEIIEEKMVENYKWPETVYEEDNTLLEGMQEVIQYGMEGYEIVSYDVTYINNVESSRKEISREIFETVDTIVKVGTLPDSEIPFKDVVFEEEIRGIINKPEGIIKISDIYHIRNLNFYGSYINDLSGIEYFYNLENLITSYSNIDDISMLSTLTKLKSLNINNTHISDISSLSTLTNLEILKMDYNEINDLSPLSGLTKLSYLSANNNEIVDISYLKNLTEIEYLSMSNNHIESISSLSVMTVLEKAYLRYNSISNLKPLEHLDKLRLVSLGHNNINDISPLLNTTIREIDLWGNYLDEDQYLKLEEALGIRINR